MPISVTDEEITALVSETKLLPNGYRGRMVTRPKRGHRERELDVDGTNGGRFRFILRESSFNPLDFSAILAWIPPHSSTLFRLRRYNGKSHEHTNTLESQTFYDFHIHQATERYQSAGLREDAFAEPTDRYESFHGAVQCLIADCGVVFSGNDQPELFEEGDPT